MAVQEELEPWVERVIDRALMKHQQTCAVVARLRRLEIMVAFLVGSIGLGGGIFGVLKVMAP